MSKYVYSAKTNAFYPYLLQEIYEQSGTWPEDGAEISDNVAREFMAKPPTGKQRVVGSDGLPAWGDIPPPTVEELAAAATKKIATLRAEADAVIAPLKDASDDGYIDDADKPRLTAWQKYRYALTKVDPANPVWPEMPI
ncbi:tail fiber assembly protein [Citrobacter freundii]|uniref:tail fiber assembly protein n=1 Tax=Citrobacter freundii TaxID=546 RepID=UPI001B957E31|nr:tail fiber assembly protein [Citrobacter freundii]HBC5417253.1 tail fiber assembly protein [Escherichia coli]